MIEIVGDKNSSEYLAALDFKTKISSFWPDIVNSDKSVSFIKISANAKLSGYKVNDIDIIVSGYFSQPKHFYPTNILLDSNGRKILNKPILIESFVIALELKEQPTPNISVSSGNIIVKYKNKWKNATDQNINQVHALNEYFKDMNSNLFIYRCLLLPNLTKSLGVKNYLGNNYSIKDFFTQIASEKPVFKKGNNFYITSGIENDILKTFDAPIFKRIIPSNLDRARMDRIASNNPAIKKILTDDQKKLTLLRGQGGSGKTVALLQAAYQSYRRFSKRTLFLTYNHALLGDLIRISALMNIPSDEENGIFFNTVMSHNFSWFHALQICDNDQSFENYSELLSQAVEFISTGATTIKDIQDVKENNPSSFLFDQIYIDEGQDWPLNEIKFLKEIYKDTNFVVADGIDQIIRGERIEWSQNFVTETKNIVPLQKCLRMKRNLSRFTKFVAEKTNLPWDLTDNEDAGGGRVVFIRGDYSSNQDFHNKIIKDMKNDGNDEIDFLACVPPDQILKNNEVRKSILSGVFKNWGFKVWDAVDENTRRDFPRELNSYRIVQYDSCRGLEGWAVLLNNFDKFLNYKYEYFLQQNNDVRNQLLDKEKIAENLAWKWGLIALSRPIDTLIIHLSNDESKFSSILTEIAENNPDICEIII